MELILTPEQQEKLDEIESDLELRDDPTGWLLRVIQDGVLDTRAIVQVLRVAIENGKGTTIHA